MTEPADPRVPGPIRPGGKVPWNLYKGPRPEDHITSFGGEHRLAADRAAWFADAANAWIAAGHPMPGGGES